MFDKILEVKNLTVTYGVKKILRDVTFSVRRGEILVIVGESGSGKSTILKAIDGLLDSGGAIMDGQIFFNKHEITTAPASIRRKLSGTEIGMIFQNCGAAFCPIRTVGEQIFEGVQAHKDWTYQEFLNRAKFFLESVNLDAQILQEYPFRLSGGMAQRAGIVAAMILEPKLLLADEPTSALDAMTQVEVVKDLLNLRDRQKISIVMVTHHMGIAYFMADKILILKDGEVVEFGTKAKIFNAPQEFYTRELLSSVPRLEKRSA